MSNSIKAKEIRVIAKLMRLARTSHFPTVLRRVVRAKLPISTFVIVNFAAQRHPIPMYQWIPNPDLKAIYLKQYMDGDYLLDPYYQHSQKQPKAGVHRLMDIAPDKYFASEYYRTYYRKTQLSDEIGVLVPLSDGSIGHLSFSRDLSDQSFSKRELRGLKEFAPILMELLRQYCEIMLKENPKLKREGVARRPLHKILFEYTKKNFAKSLTRREAEITALVLQGHSSLSASLILNISVETVKVHRKNIYRKLEISTQAELFVKLSDALNQ